MNMKNIFLICRIYLLFLICIVFLCCVSTRDQINQAVIKNDAGMIKNYLNQDLDQANIRHGLYASIKYDRPHLVKIFAAHVTKQVKGIYIGYASQLGKLHMIRLLMELGADINAKDSNGNTPLMVAVQGHIKDPREDKLYMDKHQYRVIRYLIGKGADVNVKNKNGETALAIARKKWAASENGYLIMGHLKKMGVK